jgi:transcriptional accessory protein Tex/SPT6
MKKLLNMTDLWDIFDHDLKFRALIDKRGTIQKTYDKRSTGNGYSPAHLGVPPWSRPQKADPRRWNQSRCLNMTDLWDIFDHDLKFRALIDKRGTIQKTYDNLQNIVLHILEFLHGRGRKKLILDVGISHVEDTLQVVV